MPAAPAHQRIYEDLRQRIESGELPAGTQLPSQGKLADEWHCSLAPVRQALMRLELEGLIESRQGVGAFVLSRTNR
jgi:GntR family transcriptional regulator